MANLIIKSSADNLVLQGSDASPAITVGATGTTTFAENATLSGTANALGTVATGNISNTAIVIPDGSIVQVQGNSMSSISNSTTTGTIISQAITLIDYANNDVLITATGPFTKASGGDVGHLSVFIQGGSLGSGTSGQRTTAQGLYLQANGHEETCAATYWDKAPPSASETYGIYLLCNSSLLGATNWTITLYEIKR